MTLRVFACVCALAACERDAAPAPVTRPRDAIAQLVRCAFDGLGDAPTTSRIEGAMRQALRRDRQGFAARAGACESALETVGGAHPCAARVRERWAAMLTTVQRSAVDAIDDDVAVRRVGEAYAEAMRRCVE